MDNIPVIVQHNGSWDDNTKYINFEVFGLLIPTDCNYASLVTMISRELNIYPDSTILKMEYQVKDGYPPLKIVDDQHVSFYIKLKKREVDFTTYPLCLTTENRNFQVSAVSNQSGLTGNDLGLEHGNTEGVSSNMSYSKSYEASKDNFADYVDFAAEISGHLMDMPPEKTNDDEVIEISRDEEISNNHIEELSLFQIYRDKETLLMVLSLYAIKNNFQHKVKKSCQNEYLIICLDQNCKWLLRASRNGKTNQFVIRKLFNNHTCDLEIQFKDQRQATTSVIANAIKHKFSNIKTRYSVVDIIRDMRHDHNVQVKYNKAWRSKEKVLEITKGNATESFAELYPYLYMLYTTNAGSIVELQLTKNSCFLYVFVALISSMK